MPDVNRAPKEGTQLRRIYDLLQANKGKPVLLDTIKSRSQLYQTLEQLRNFYGQDIKSISTGAKVLNCKYEHVLVGEHIGRKYVSYV